MNNVEEEERERHANNVQKNDDGDNKEEPNQHVDPLSPPAKGKGTDRPKNSSFFFQLVHRAAWCYK